MKNFLLAACMTPFLSFGQLDASEMETLNSYALDMCECVNDLMTQLHPKTSDAFLIMAQENQVEALEEFDILIAQLPSDELDKFIASIDKLQDPDFLAALGACDNSETLANKLSSQINDQSGEAHYYLMGFLHITPCEIMKALYDIGMRADE